MADDKAKVTLIQSRDGQVRRARINGTEIAVVSGGPVLIAGKMSVSLTLTDIELDAEVAGEENAQIPATAAATGSLRTA